MLKRETFFASGQAYVALSRVRTLNDLVLWKFHPSAIYLEPFYQQLLQWCDNVDVIRPTPPTDIIEHPQRHHDFLSNAPLPKPSDNSDEHKSGSIQFTFDPAGGDSNCTVVSNKRGRGHPRKNTTPDPTNKAQPKHSRGRPRKSQPPDSTWSGATSNIDTVCPPQPQAPDSSQPPKRSRGRPRKSQPPDCQCSTSSTTPKSAVACPPKPPAFHTSQPQSMDGAHKHETPKGIKRANDDDSGQPPSKVLKLGTPNNAPSNGLFLHRNITSACGQLQQTVRQLLGNTSPESVLSSMLSLSSVQNIIDAFNGMHEALEAMTKAVNLLPPVYVNDFPALPTAVSIRNQCHPLMLHTYKPVLTTGDGDYMYHALSRVVCGSEQLSKIFRLLTAYAAVKYRDVPIQSLQYAFPSRPSVDNVRNANTLIVHALRIGSWGSDFHLFPLSLLLNRPIFMYVFFSSTDEDGVRTMMLADIDNVSAFAQKFLAFARGTRQHLQWCSSVHRAMLISGDVTILTTSLATCTVFLHTVILQH